MGPSGKVFAFEPSAENRVFLERHLALNEARNVRVVPAAVSTRTGEGSFLLVGQNSFTGRLVGEGKGTATSVVGLDEEIASRRLPAPDVIKIDAEGSEMDALEGMRVLLRTKRPMILASIQPKDQKTLSEFGYICESLEGKLESATEIFARPVK